MKPVIRYGDEVTINAVLNKALPLCHPHIEIKGAIYQYQIAENTTIHDTNPIYVLARNDEHQVVVRLWRIEAGSKIESSITMPKSATGQDIIDAITQVVTTDFLPAIQKSFMWEATNNPTST